MKTDGEPVENVENFIVLRSLVQAISDYIKRRISHASTAFERLAEKICHRKDIPYYINNMLYYAQTVFN